jgi:hypothetical protein
MKPWHDQVWTLTGAHPVELPLSGRKIPLPFLVVQRGQRLYTREIADHKIQVDLLDSAGSLLGTLGIFDVQDDRSIQCCRKIEGTLCYLELTLTCFHRTGPLLTGVVCPVEVNPPTGDEEGAIGGFSAEAQGGNPDDRRS